MPPDALARPDLEFPPLPPMLAPIAALLAEGAAASVAPHLAALVGADADLEAAVLRRCRGAFYGLRHPVETAQRAMLLLGAREAANLAATAAVLQLRRLLQTETQHRLFERTLRHGLATAAFSAELAAQLDLPQAPEPAQAFAAGLLHGLGRVVLLYNAPEAYEEAWAGHGEAPPLEAERARFGTDYAEVGAYAAAHERLPLFFRYIIQHHPTPERLPTPELRCAALVVAVAAAAARRLYRGQVHPPAARLRRLGAEHQLAHAAGLPVAELEALLANRVEEIYTYVEAMMGEREMVA